ncbi:MAG: 50S ribosomal protein L9 [Acidobacteria bacterium]|nr:50S ribosomal protein L9 [Acidobacteriota bacterium]
MEELILRENIDHLGRRGDIVKVAGGYARNYLLPRKLALPVTAANRRQVERERALAEQREAEERQTAQALADRVAAVECEIARRVGEHDTLYGSVTNADIAEHLAAQALEIDKRQVQLEEPIKQLGEFTVPVRIHRDVEASVRVRVVREGDDAGASD